MTPVILLALIAAIPPTLAAIAAFIVGMVNSGKADKIHILVNSNLSEVKANLIIAEKRITLLEQIIVDLKKGV